VRVYAWTLGPLHSWTLERFEQLEIRINWTLVLFYLWTLVLLNVRTLGPLDPWGLGPLQRYSTSACSFYGLRPFEAMGTMELVAVCSSAGCGRFRRKWIQGQESWLAKSQKN
jgi:hypothetical protein